jgi:tetrahydromethanopterin S-methyltransferase subunit E
VGFSSGGSTDPRGEPIAEGANKRIMGQASSQFWKRALVALVLRREPRGIWLYTICAIVVALYALSVLYGIGAEAASPRLSDFLVPALWLSVPVAVAVVQVWRQTLLGWFLLLAGFTVVGVGLCYWLIEEQLRDPWPVTLLATAIAICVGLIWHRPTRGVRDATE